MTASNVTGLYCPGCAPGDFPQSHICGHGQAPVIQTWPIVQTTPRPACDHCFCLKQKQGSYRVPDDYTGSYFHLKPHKLCCMCGSRRVRGRQ